MAHVFCRGTRNTCGKSCTNYNQFNCHVFCRGTQNKKQIASDACWPANTMWCKLFYSEFHTPKAVTDHEPTVMWLFMIGHSHGRVETYFGPSTQGAGIRYQNTSQIQIVLASHLEKKGVGY